MRAGRSRLAIRTAHCPQNTVCSVEPFTGVATNTATRMPLRMYALLWLERFSVTSTYGLRARNLSKGTKSSAAHD